MNIIKARKVLSEITATAFASAKTIRKAAENISPASEKLPVPSASQVLSYHQVGGTQTSVTRKLAKKLSPREILEMRKKELRNLAELRENDTLPSWDTDFLASEEAFKYKRIKEMIFIPARKNCQLSLSELYKVLELSDEQYKMFSRLISIEGRRNEQFSSSEVLTFVKNATTEQFQKAKMLSFIKGRGPKQLHFWQIEDFIQHSTEEFERIKKLVFIPNRKFQQLDYNDISRACQLNRREFKNLAELLSYNPDNSRPFTFYEIRPFLSDNKICKRLKELHYVKELGENQIYLGYIVDFARLSDYKYSLLKKLLRRVDKIKDGQIDFSQILEKLKQEPEKIKKMISYLGDEKLKPDSDIFYKLLERKDMDVMAEAIKHCPHIPPDNILNLLNHTDKKPLRFILPFLYNPDYHISKEFGWFVIKNKQNNSVLKIFSKNTKNTEYILEKALPNGETETTIIIKTQYGTYTDKKICNPDEILANGNYKKLHNFPPNASPEELYRFMEKGDFRTSKLFKSISTDMWHANIKLPRGSNTYKKVNGSIISQLDTAKSKTPERITIHYPDGRIAINDWALGLSTTLEKNSTNTGMRIRKFYGADKIDLTSSVENDFVTITDNLTGKQIKCRVSEVFGTNEVYAESLEIPLEQKQEEVVKLLRKLSPTTILNLLKYKNQIESNLNRKVAFPFLKSWKESYHDYVSVTLSESPQATSHEMFHGITEMLNLTDDAELLGTHAKEVKKNTGLLSILSAYATDAIHNGQKCGLDELIAIMGTIDEYGVEGAYRAEATRLAFPETIKAIEKRLMEYYKKTIDELLK